MATKKIKKTKFMNLKDRVVLVGFETKMPPGRKGVRGAAVVVDEKYNANGSGHFSKFVWGSEFLAPMRKIKNTHGKDHREDTLSWEKPYRMLDVRNKAEYDKRYRKAKDSWEDAVANAESLFFEELKRAEVRLGDLFDRKDYPEKSDFRSLFKFEMLPTKAIESTEDLRIHLSNEELDIVERNLTRKYGDALSGVWKRVEENVGRLSESIGLHAVDPDTGKVTHGYHKTAVENLRKLVEVLPNLNIDNDPKLIEISNRIEAELTKYEVEELKADGVISEAVRKSAEDILAEAKSKIEGYEG